MFQSNLSIDVEEVSDSDEELDAILEIDAILKDFHNEPHSASHTKIYTLFKRLRKIEDVVDLESEIMKEVIDQAISPQLPYFSDLSQVQDIAHIGKELNVQHESFWNAIAHCIAVNHQDMDLTN